MLDIRGRPSLFSNAVNGHAMPVDWVEALEIARVTVASSLVVSCSTSWYVMFAIVVACRLLVALIIRMLVGKWMFQA